MSGQCYVKEDKVSSICIQTGISIEGVDEKKYFRSQQHLVVVVSLYGANKSFIFIVSE